MRNEQHGAAPQDREATSREDDRRASGTHVRVRPVASANDAQAGQAPAARADGELPPATDVVQARLVAARPRAAADEREAESQRRASAFARLVLAVARDAAFGADRALIEPVWRAAFTDVSLDEFKQLLFATHKRGLLVLGRADLRSHRYPRAELAASEVARSSLRFHFILTDVPRRPSPTLR